MQWKSEAEGQRAARGLSAISLNTLVGVAGGFLFVTLTPRALGAEVYGQLAYAYAYAVLFQLIGELGYQEIFARFLPELREDIEDRKRLVFPLLAFKFAAGLALGALAGLVAIPTARYLPVAAGTTLRFASTDWLTAPLAVLLGLSVALRVWATGLFALLLGEGRTAQWSVETTWRPLVVTGLLIVVFHAHTLSTALTAFAVHEVLFLLAGLWWVKKVLPPFVSPEAIRNTTYEARNPNPVFRISYPELSRFLQLGGAFALANLALTALFRLGPLVTQWLTGHPAQAGFVDLALSGLLVAHTFVGQVAYALVPILTRLRLAGQGADAKPWLRGFLGWGTLLCALAAGAMWFLASPITRLLFGPGFEEAAFSVRALAPAALLLPLLHAGVVLATVEKQPGHKVRAALAGLAVFLVAAWMLRGNEAAGISAAFTLGLGTVALVIGVRVLRLKRALGE